MRKSFIPHMTKDHEIRELSTDSGLKKYDFLNLPVEKFINLSALSANSD